MPWRGCQSKGLFAFWKKRSMYLKKILVLSDSHGNVNNMVTAVRNTHPDQIIHLGDCWVDAEKLHRQFPMIMMEQVPGN